MPDLSLRQAKITEITTDFMLLVQLCSKFSHAFTGKKLHLDLCIPLQVKFTKPKYKNLVLKKEGSQYKTYYGLTLRHVEKTASA